MDEQRARELLARERSRIEHELSELAPEFDPDSADVLTETEQEVDEHLYDKERDVGRRAELREELAAVERAEQRLAEGTYGLSVESGQPIPDGRLELIPYAERTAEEQSRYERLGR
ncbi:MAG TPA: TraR/DksA C4-type zinc finger protein [Miltoncostaeaceae bacterium]|nr:TraR/DksA C4-type zinc finger protein [Miltoncostaeaceae bacterium]